MLLEWFYLTFLLPTALRFHGCKKMIAETGDGLMIMEIRSAI
jgi:hypothetical protein